MTRVLGVILAVSAVFIAGCGDDDDDSEATTSSTLPSTSATAPPDEALPVPTPRDASRVITDPCSAFTPEQLAGFGVTEPGTLVDKPSERSPEACSWPALALTNSLSVDVFVRQFSADEEASGYLDTGQNERNEMTQVGGNPAAIQQVFVGDTRCETDVLITPLQVMSVGVTRGGNVPPDPCVPARELAQIAVDNLPPLG